MKKIIGKGISFSKSSKISPTKKPRPSLSKMKTADLKNMKREIELGIELAKEEIDSKNSPSELLEGPMAETVKQSKELIKGVDKAIEKRAEEKTLLGKVKKMIGRGGKLTKLVNAIKKVKRKRKKN